MESVLSRIYPRIIDGISEGNPQLFREIKGRLKGRNIAIVSLASILGQFLLYLYFENLLPSSNSQYSRYCTGTNTEYYSSLGVCQTDLNGNLQLIKELWWLDLFTTMSLIGIVILLVAGSYLLIADISKENSRNTLNFLRLTPQSAFTIMGGKVLGVPILVYLFGAWAIPLHFFAGLSANIPFYFIFAFYALLGVSCLFFYSASLFFSLITTALGGFQAWLGSLMIFFFSMMMMGVALESHNLTSTSFDWLVLFYPGTFLIYLSQATFISSETIGYLSENGLNNLSWYGYLGWQNALSAFALMAVNYGIWTFWLWQGIKRRFHNPHHTPLSKHHSYLITACFVVFNLGFTLQQFAFNSHDNYQAQLFTFILFNFIYLLALGVMLTPPRQILFDWSRFRHQNSLHRHLFSDLIFGDDSPVIGAIAINVSIMTLYVIPSLLIFPLKENKLMIIMGLILGGMMVIFYGTLYQLILTLKTNKRSLIAVAVLSSIIFSPVFIALIYGAKYYDTLTFTWLFSPFPAMVINDVSMISIFGSFLTQIVLIFGFNYQLKRVLNKAGVSETKALLTSSK